MTHYYNFINLSRVFLLISTLLFPSKVLTQSLSKSTIDFTEVPGWDDYRQCVRDCFMDLCALQCIDQLGILIGCYNEQCLCGTRTNYELGIKQALVCVKRPSSCAGEQTDQEAAKKVLTDYCAMKGWDYSDGGDNDVSNKDTETVTVTQTVTETVSRVVPVTSIVTVTAETSRSGSGMGGGISFTHEEDCYHGKYHVNPFAFTVKYGGGKARSEGGFCGCLIDFRFLRFLKPGL